MEACIPSQASCCGLYGGQTDIVRGFSPLSSLSIIPPILHTNIFFMSQPAPNLATKKTLLKEKCLLLSNKYIYWYLTTIFIAI
jgi:hypothetical protein